MAADPVVRPDAALSWLALALTPGLGPTRARKLAEHFGSAEKIFLASLTELEACGLHAAAAQAIATGKSAALAQEELGKLPIPEHASSRSTIPRIRPCCVRSTIRRS